MTELAGAPHSYWLDSTGPGPAGAALPTEVDVAVLGAGIAGLTSAHLLAERGQSVAVIEAREVAGGTSGHTTAKVTVQHGLIYDRLTERFGPDTAAAYGQSQLAALAWLREQAARIECEWEPRDSVVYVTEPDRVPQLRAEARAAQRLGLPAEFTDSLDLPYPVAGAVRFTGQAQFHPRKWLLGLATAVASRGGSLHPGVRATGLDEGDPCQVTTTAGTVRAREVVVATQYPIFDRGGYFGRLTPVRDLVVAGPVPAGSAPWAMYIAADTRRSIRTAPLDVAGQRLLIIGGEHYRTGAESDIRQRYAAAADWAKRTMGLTTTTHHWSAHDLTTLDGLPYIGRYHPFSKHLWVATGFGLWGMTTGTLAGMLLADLVTGAGNPWASTYDPGRFNGPAAVELLRDGAAMARYAIGSHVEAIGATPADRLGPGQATVFWRGARPVAACRDEGGGLHAVSARCTHLGCLVRWNDAERSWDCPCHGSRYGRDGAVLQGPAVRPLGKVDL